MQATKIKSSASVMELVDNSFSAEASRIHCILRQLSEDQFELTVADNGCGIPEDRMSDVLGIGHEPDDTHLGMFNQYGRGLKSSLASLDSDNANWEVHSTVDGKVCTCITAPYSEDGTYVIYENYEDMGMPEEWEHGHGTVVRAPMSRAMFESVNLRLQNKTDASFLASFAELLQVAYGPVLKRTKVELKFTFISESGEKQTQIIEPKLPIWKKGMSYSKTEICDFGRGEVEVQYTVGAVEPYSENLVFLQCNQETSGLMIFCKGRLIKHNLFPEIWNSKHNKYNAFLFVVDMKPVDNKWDSLPMFRPDKDEMVEGDPCFKAFAKWIRQICPDPAYFLPAPKKSREVEKCKAFAERLESDGLTDLTVTEMDLGALDGRKAPLRADIYVRLKDGRSIMYEAKMPKSKVNDLGQLAINCLMAARDGLMVQEIVLIAKSHSEDVKRFVKDLEEHWFRNLEIPKIRLLTWAEADAGNY